MACLFCEAPSRCETRCELHKPKTRRANFSIGDIQKPKWNPNYGEGPTVRTVLHSDETRQFTFQPFLGLAAIANSTFCIQRTWIVIQGTRLALL